LSSEYSTRRPSTKWNLRARRTFDVRASEDFIAGHLPGFRHYPGGQLVQQIDMAAPVRGARILLTDDMGVRADMTASWLAQMGWEIHVLDGGYDGAPEGGRTACSRKDLLETGMDVGAAATRHRLASAESTQLPSRNTELAIPTT
jgi:rhodanese-related sulfurtransferase